jgi:type IV secretion system protein VirB9
VVTVPVKRGVVTLVVLDADESITEVAAGLGGDCTKADAAWCVAAQPGGRNLFVKAEELGQRREQPGRGHRPAHAHLPFRGPGRRRPEAPVYRLVVKVPPRPAPPRASRCAKTRCSSRCRWCRPPPRPSKWSRSACKPSRR